MFALTLAALTTGAPVPPPRSRPVYDSAALTAEQALALAGRTIRVRADIVDPCPECAGAGDDDDAGRWVIWRRGDETADDGEMVVEGRLTVRYVPAHVLNGELVEGYHRLRLEAARPIREREDD